ncbi:hypothetical protein QL285_069073 [Trifolium repens]|nr:hypothetical protein QL285_069073 [Trifolium repens]
MTAQPTHVIVQEPFNPELILVIDLNSRASFVNRPPSTDCGRDAMEFLTEKFVDFESLKVNGIDIQSLFYDQQWGNYFDMSNGFVYYDIVKNFWHKAYVFDEFSANEEVSKLVAKDKTLRGKTRVQLGLRPFKGKEIRYNLLGIDVLITQEHVAKILGLDNKGQDVNAYKLKSKYTESIKEDLFPAGTKEKEFGRAKFMKKEFNFAFKVLLASIIPREGGNDTISVPHKHFLWFLHKRVKINLASLLFEHLCSCIVENQTKAVATLHHPRLLSEIIRQTKLIEILRQREKLRVFQTAKFDATILVNMKLVKKEDLIKPENPLKTIYETYFWCDGFPTISEHDNEDIIKNFLAMVRRETGKRVDRSMVVGVPDWDIFKGPKDITRSRKKPILVEQALLEENAEESNDEGQGNESEEESIDDKVDNAAERLAAEKKAKAEAEAAERATAAKNEKEKRTKKRNERPSSSGDDDNVPLSAKIPIKRQKMVASKPPLKAAGISKGNVSEPNTCSNSEAQTQNQPPSSTSIDFTKPLRMIIPTPISSDSSSSSSDGTLNDSSSETISEVIKSAPKPKPKSKPYSKISTPKEVVAEDTSFLDHLTPHLSGDAFTHSNLNSPNHPINKFLNVTAETPIKPVVQEPPIISVETPSPHSAAPEQNCPNTINTSEPEKQTPQMPQSKSHTPPPSDKCDDNHSDNQKHHIPSEPNSAETQNIETPPSTHLIYGSFFKPLTLEELSLPIDFALPILEDYLKKQINIDDEPESTSEELTSEKPSIDLRKIKIIPLKRKRPEPTIPFNRNHPFFNPISEPNLELLDIAISISLKRFKNMEKETFVFPSDVDAEIRDLEDKFSESLRLLGDYVKSKIEGRGMNALTQIMRAEEISHAPRLTFYNHEKECQRLAMLAAAVNESIRTSLEAAKRLNEEETTYARVVIDAEQARIAAEVERKRLADQEALKLLVDRAVHIAVIETNKIYENQATEEDCIMHDQNLSEPDSDKGKAAIVDSSPPRSPPILVQGSSSSAIPSAMQLALDEIKSDLREELRNEMDEFRADIREDMNKSGEATNKKIDAMMELLLKLTQQQPKP